MNIGGHEFEGIYTDVDEIPRRKEGVYVVLCLIGDEPHCVLDIGTSNQLRERLTNHDRKDCWDEHVHGVIGYCIKRVSGASMVPTYPQDPTNVSSEKLQLERELKWKLEHPCGTNRWVQIELDWKRYKEYEDEYGFRGSFDV